MTYAEKLKEALPKADIEQLIDVMCPGDLFGESEPIHYNADCPNINYGISNISIQNNNCKSCWKQEYKEDRTNGL